MYIVLAARSWSNENLLIPVNVDKFPGDDQPKNHDREIHIFQPPVDPGGMVKVAPPKPEKKVDPPDHQDPKFEATSKSMQTTLPGQNTKVKEVKDGGHEREGAEKAEPDFSDEGSFINMLSETGVSSGVCGEEGGGGEDRHHLE